MLKLFIKVLNSISLSKVLVWALSATAALVLYTIVENRDRLTGSIMNPPNSNPVGLTFLVSQSSRAIINNKVKTDRDVIGISVRSADLRMNESKSVYFFSDDPQLNEVISTAHAAGNTSIPLFTSDEQNNQSTIRLVNGQFSCQKFQDTLVGKLYPELKASVKTICQASIPSYYGYFSGFVTEFLSANPTPAQEAQLKISLEKIATDIYFSDVVTTQYREPAKK